MAAPSTMPSLDRTAGSLGVWIGIVLLFVFFGVFVLVLIGLSPRGDSYEAKRAKAREEKLKTAREEATKDLHSYAWVDKTKGVARIPIDRAMQLALADLAQKKPAPANPIAAPSPPAAQLPAGSPAAQGQQSAAAQIGAAAPSALPQKSVTPKPTSVSGPNSEIRNQPAAAANPTGAQPGTQPGAAATSAATPGSPGGQSAASPTGTPVQSPPGSPLPVRGKTPP